MTLLVQSPGSAYVVDGLALQQLVQRKPAILLAFSKYVWAAYETVTAFAALSHLTDVKRRVAHWLLLSAKCCAPDALMITHAHIAQMLGVRRASITLAAREMKVQGLIAYSRGYMEIKKPEALQRVASG